MPKDLKTEDAVTDPLSSKPRKERRAPRGTPGSLRWMREVLGRPLALERRDKAVRLVLVERRRRPEVIRAEALTQLCYELGLRLVELESSTAHHAMRHLIAVHDTLARKGWSGVETMPARILGKSVVQAQMISGREPSPRMRAFVDHLRKLQVAAEVREDRLAHPAQFGHESAVEVNETTSEAFEASQREWVGTVVPTDLVKG
jgi:site-specific recombinase XerC